LVRAAAQALVLEQVLALVWDLVLVRVSGSESVQVAEVRPVEVWVAER
jgi:hypothetical protein